MVVVVDLTENVKITSGKWRIQEYYENKNKHS